MGAPGKTMQRSLELPAVIAVSVSAMLGSGIFVLPGLAAAETGPSLWIAYVLASVMVMPFAVSKSELATAMPESGGTYVYLDRAFGPFAGTVAGLGLWLSLLLKGAFALVGMAAYLSVVAEVPFRTLSLLVITAIVLINIRGVKGVGQAQTLMVIISLVALAGMGLVGIRNFDSELMVDPLPHGGGGLLTATALVFVSYAGVTKVAAIAGEVRRPGRNLPGGILISLVIVSLVYALVTLVLAGNVEQETLQNDLHPIFTLAKQEGGLALGVPIAVVGALTMAAMANAGLLAASRFPFAMSRENLLPPSLGYLHPASLTPVVAIVASGVLMAITILVLDVEKIAKLASAFVILIFMVVSATVIVLRESRVQWYQPQFRSPLYPWLQIVGIAGGFVLLAAMGLVVIAGLAMVTVPGVALWVLYGRHRTERQGIVAQRGPRTALLRGTGGRSATASAMGIDDHAKVLVPLFGRERSPEMLVEVASALADAERTKVVHLTQIPEQTSLEAGRVEEDFRVTSLARRIGAMGEERSAKIEFDAMVSRDIIRAVHQLAADLDSVWLFVEWGGRTRGLLTVANPLGWLASHVSCNLATFYDSGARYIRKILVLVEPGPHDSLVVDTADHLATVHKAELTFARFIASDAAPTVVQSAADYLDQVRELSEAPSDTALIRGKDPARAIGHETGRFDLMIVGEAPARHVFRRLFETELDRITTWAACSVLRVQAPRERIHKSVSQGRGRRPISEEFHLLNYIDTECIQANLEPMSKDALFTHVAKTLATVVDDVDADEILSALWARERMQNTSVGDGFALPHATIHTTGRSRVAIFTMKSPIGYQAPDGKDADIFVVTLGPPRERQTHLLLLAEIAKMVLGTALLDQLRAAETGEEIMQIVKKATT